MSIVEIFIVLLTVVLLCSWAYLAWAYNNESKIFKRFPPYGISHCPLHWKLNDDKQCIKNENIYGHATDTVSVLPYDRDKPCESYNAHKSLSQGSAPLSKVTTVFSATSMRSAVLTM